MRLKSIDKNEFFKNNKFNFSKKILLNCKSNNIIELKKISKLTI